MILIQTYPHVATSLSRDESGGKGCHTDPEGNTFKIVGCTMNPSTLIHRPFAKATKAREITKEGKSEDINTTRLSAAKRSQKSQNTQVKKAVAVGWKFTSQ